jgi:hypothetical protein
LLFCCVGPLYLASLSSAAPVRVGVLCRRGAPALLLASSSGSGSMHYLQDRSLIIIAGATTTTEISSFQCQSSAPWKSTILVEFTMPVRKFLGCACDCIAPS